MMSTPPWRVAAPRNGAFTTVAARTTLSKPALTPVYTTNTHDQPPPPPPPERKEPTPKKTTKVNWPEEIRQYVQRAFVSDYQIPGIEREEMEAKLKEFIQLAHDNGTMYQIDWEALPLPQEMIARERKMSRLGTSNWRADPLDSPLPQPPIESNPKKRKSWDLQNARTEDVAQQPPWRKTNNRAYFESRNAFEDRVTHPSPSPSLADRTSKATQKHEDTLGLKGSSKFHNKAEKRARRFADNDITGIASPQHPWSNRNDSHTPDVVEGPIVGRSQTLEKQYFRLTSAPNPNDVRPLPVLRETLNLLKEKWRKEKNYSYICDQFKSLRQDLTVQHIKNEFTVIVYEIHARIALEKGDIGEYNQCQTQLRTLYSQNLGGHPMEFKAYRILYFIYTCNRTDMNNVLADLTPAEKKDSAVKHALDVRSALALGNYHRFFQLYHDTPHMGAYLMDMFIERERLSALSHILRAYKFGVKLRFVTEELGFESDAKCYQFLIDNHAKEFIEQTEDEIKLMTGKSNTRIDAAVPASLRPRPAPKDR